VNGDRKKKFLVVTQMMGAALKHGKVPDWEPIITSWGMVGTAGKKREGGGTEKHGPEQRIKFSEDGGRFTGHMESTLKTELR